MLQSIITFLLFASTLLSNHVRCDNHDSCEFWASIGECAKNPNYMLDNCADACAAVDQTVANNIPESIFDIVEEDLFGREFRLDSLKGKVIYIVNVASQCGYTQSNYEEMREIRKDFHRKDLEMIIQPCNSFGAQEPGDPRQIKQFAFHLGYNGMILSKGEVNGPETRPLFKFLKSKTGKNNISWNFDGKFLVDRMGNVMLPGADLRADIQALVDQFADL